MLLRPAKSNQPIAVIIIPLICFAIWFNPLIGVNINSHVDTSIMPFYAYLLKVFPPYTYISKLIGAILVVIIAFMISRLNTKFIIISERTYLPSIIYIFIVCGLIPNKELYSVLPAIIFFLIAFEKILDSFKFESLSYKIFDAALFLSIASLFYFNILFFIIFIWISIITLRPFHWREWVFILLGVFVPYFVLFSLYYLSNTSIEPILTAIKGNFIFETSFTINNAQYALVSILILLMLISSRFIMQVSSSKKILVRKSFNLFLWLFIITIAGYFAINSAGIEMVFIGAIPVSYLLSVFFITARQTRWMEILFDMFVISLIVTQVLKM